MKLSKFTIVAAAALAVACSDPASDDDGPGTNNMTTGEMTPPDTAEPYLDDETARQWDRAGKDYPEDRVDLDRRIQALMAEEFDGERRRAFGLVAPHAGLRYSGGVAASAYARVEVPDTVVLMAAKHHSDGANPAIWKGSPFLVPGHALEIRDDLVDSWVEKTGEEVENDPAAFTERNNHPTELQLPFISTVNPDAKLVPFVVEDTSRIHFADFDVERIELWGKALADMVREAEADGEEVLVVASVDLVHRTPLDIAEPQDEKFMNYLVDLDVAGMHQWVVEEEVTICSEIVAAILMTAAKELGHTDAEITGTATTYDETGNADSVVGYGGAVIWHSEGTE